MSVSCLVGRGGLGPQDTETAIEVVKNGTFRESSLEMASESLIPYDREIASNDFIAEQKNFDTVVVQVNFSHRRDASFDLDHLLKIA